MRTIRPEFHDRARRPLLTAANASDTGSEAETAGDFTLEMTDSPFASLMRRIERLIDNGLREDTVAAFELARTALADRMFSGRQEELLTEKMAALVEKIHEGRLAAPFTRSALHASLSEPAVLPHTPKNVPRPLAL